MHRQKMTVILSLVFSISAYSAFTQYSSSDNLRMFLLEESFSSINDVNLIYVDSEKEPYDVESNYKANEDTILKYANKLKQMSHSFVDPKNKILKKFSELCESSSKHFLELNEDGILMDNSELVAFVQRIADYLVLKNPELLRHRYKIFIVRDPEMNAYNLGEGIIVMHIGLLAQAMSVEQIAFVLAHEMSHDLKKHIQRSAELMAATFTDKSLNKDYRKASRKEYGTMTARRNLYLSVVASLNLHSRTNEFEADSLGAHICRNAGISLHSAVEVLNMLKSADELTYKDTLDLQELLNTSEYEISDESTFGNDHYRKWAISETLYKIPDSLRTHPNCDSRIQRISKHYLAAGQTNDLITMNSEFKDLNYKFDFEFIHCLLEENYISLAHYYALCYKKNNGGNPFIDAVIVYCFYEYYKSIVEHRFGAVTVFPDERNPYGYNKFLEFLHAQNSRIFAKIATGIYNENLKEAGKSEIIDFTREYGLYVLNKEYKNPSIEKNYFKNSYYQSKFDNLTNTH